MVGDRGAKPCVLLSGLDFVELSQVVGVVEKTKHSRTSVVKFAVKRGMYYFRGEIWGLWLAFSSGSQQLQ